MQELQVLNDKLDILLKKYTALQAENKRLKATMSYQLQSIESLNDKLNSLEENMLTIQVGRAVENSDDKDNMRKQLDNIIGEIDKILNALND
jgi:predicted RNase H-like nuclease (RuvC/YqgF family)